jgi:fibronectin type 3 domain-containing protein
VYVAAGGSGGACTAYDETTGASVWSQHTNGDATSAAVVGSTLYCGGHFGGAGAIAGQSRKGIAALDTATGNLLPFAPVLDMAQPVWSVASQPGDSNVYVGGDFVNLSFLQQSHFAMFLGADHQGTALPPSSFTAQAGDGVVHLSWAPPSSDENHVVTGYTIFRGTTPGGELKKSLAAPDATTFVFDDTAVTNGQAYYYTIVTRNSAGKGVTSTEVTATPASGIVPSLPGAPTMMAVANPPAEIDLLWNPPASNGGAPIVSYNVYRSTTAGGEGTTPYATGVNGLAFADLFNVSAGTTYFYRVAAVNAAGVGPQSSEVSAVETAGKPGIPVLSATVSGSSVNLTWTTPPNGGTPITKYVLTRDAVRVPGNINGTKNAFTDTTAPPGQHVYRIKALNAQGSGLYSAPVTVTI